MTTAWLRFLAATHPGQDPGPLSQGGNPRATYGVAGCLIASLLAAGLLAGGNATRHSDPVGVAPGVITDPPAPAYVLQLERDPFR